MKHLKIEYLKIGDLTPYENNARKHEKADLQTIENSIKEFGMIDPIGIWGDKNIIVEGHGRLLALKELGYSEAPCIRLDHLTDEQRKAYALAHNKTAEMSDWDFDKLELELSHLEEIGMDMSDFGFDELEEIDDNKTYDDFIQGNLANKFLVPPFSILDGRQGQWQEKKKAWGKYIKSGDGRSDNLIGEELNILVSKMGGNTSINGTSIFDPFLCEILYNWFCPTNGKVIDPFAGGSVRGLVASFLGLNYTGIDLSKQQIEANYNGYETVKHCKDFMGNELKKPNWINADSLTIDEIIRDIYDFLLTCPPYADLEVYSDDKRDISNMPYPQFISVYNEIIKKAVGKLKENAFAAIVVGEVRDKKGYNYGFVRDTIKAFENAGMKYYNECILIDPVGTAALRAGKCFSAKRKVVKVHQNVLIFVKGNEKEIVSRLKPYQYDFE